MSPLEDEKKRTLAHVQSASLAITKAKESDAKVTKLVRLVEGRVGKAPETPYSTICEPFVADRSMQPCDACLDLKVSDANDRWQLVIKPDLTPEYSLAFDSSRLMAAVESRCATCFIVSSGLALISRQLSLFDVAQPYRGRFILSDCPLEVEIFDNEKEKEDDAKEQDRDPQETPRARIQFYAMGNEVEGGAGPFSAARDVPAELSVERCRLIVSTWITNCRLNHKACATATPRANELPRRLLDLKHRGTAAVVLVQTRDHAEGLVGQYATLSHCWGKAHIIQTTKENVALRKQGIAWDHLPKTFQDAITIVRALDIRFLWIDSLCILQDDVLDWQQESVRMAAIYSNSYINIAATGASDSRGGCLCPRSLRHTVPVCDVNSFAVDVPPYAHMPTIYVRPSLERVHQRFSARRSHELDLPDSQAVPLLSRAWVFQERHLAPRTLHFHPAEMIMECKSSLCCECSVLDNAIPQNRRSCLHLESPDQSDILTAWLDVVEEYSKLRLTRASDRLPALTGVAAVLQKKLGSRYLAGIWEADIARGILWDVTRYNCVRSEMSRRRHDSAPTWSWASLILDNDGSGILFPAVHDDTFLVDVRFHFLGTDIPFAATDCSLVASRMKFILLHGISVAAIALPNEVDAFTWKDLALIFERDVGDLVLITTIEMNTDCTWKSPDACPLRTGSTVHCLLVGHKTNTDLESGKKTRYQSTLVLNPCSSNTRMVERVGVLSIAEHLGIFQRPTESSFKLI